MAVAHLASLPSKCLALSALAKACVAKQRMMANAPPIRAETPPIRAETLQLADQSRVPPQPDHLWDTLECLEAKFSPCGGYLTVTLGGWQANVEERPDRSLCDVLANDVVLHHASTMQGFQQQAKFCTGATPPVVQWSFSGNHCIAQLRANSRQFKQAQPSEGDPQAGVMHCAAFIWEPRTGSLVHSLSPETSAVFQKLRKRAWRHAAWSPSCQRLLVHELHKPGADTYEHSGKFWVLDVVQNTLLAQSRITAWQMPVCSGNE